jgi:hypothetical protein
MERTYSRRKSYTSGDPDQSEDMGLALDDFKQILEAVSLFREVYNDLEIPGFLDIA